MNNKLTIMRIMQQGKEIIKIYADGNVEISPDADLNKASKEFYWKVQEQGKEAFLIAVDEFVENKGLLKREKEEKLSLNKQRINDVKDRADALHELIIATKKFTDKNTLTYFKVLCEMIQEISHYIMSGSGEIRAEKTKDI